MSGFVPVTRSYNSSCVTPSYSGAGGFRAPLIVELYVGHLGGELRCGHWNLKSKSASGGDPPSATSQRIELPDSPTGKPCSVSTLGRISFFDFSFALSSFFLQQLCFSLLILKAFGGLPFFRFQHHLPSLFLFLYFLFTLSSHSFQIS